MRSSPYPYSKLASYVPHPFLLHHFPRPPLSRQPLPALDTARALVASPYPQPDEDDLQRILHNLGETILENRDPAEQIVATRRFGSWIIGPEWCPVRRHIVSAEHKCELYVIAYCRGVLEG